MNLSQTAIRKLSLIFASGLVGMLLLSLYFWRERVFILDASFQSFSLIAAQDYAIQVKRYGAVIVQSLPLLFTKMGFSLKAILISYSLSFTLYPLLLFGLLLWMRMTRYAWMLALFFLILMTHTFFWMQSELIQSTAIAIFTFGVYRKESWTVWLRYPLVILLILATVYTHPLGVVPLAFGFTFLAIGGGANAWNIRRFFTDGSFVVLSIILFAVKQFLLGTGEYDNTAVDMIKNVPQYIGDFFRLSSWARFKHQLATTYQFVPLLFFGLVYWYGKRKAWIKLACFLFGVGVWLGIVMATWHYGAEQFYIESYYLMLAFFIGVPLALDVLPKLKAKQALLFASILVVYRLVMIVGVGQRYEDREDYLYSLVQQVQDMPDQRYVMQEGYLDKGLLEMFWGLPYATLMLSVMDDPDKPRTILTYPDEVPGHVEEFYSRGMPTPWGPFLYEWFNGNQYFRLSDTTRIQDISGEIDAVFRK